METTECFILFQVPACANHGHPGDVSNFQVTENARAVVAGCGKEHHLSLEMRRRLGAYFLITAAKVLFTRYSSEVRNTAEGN